MKSIAIAVVALVVGLVGGMWLRDQWRGDAPPASDLEALQARMEALERRGTNPAMPANAQGAPGGQGAAPSTLAVPQALPNPQELQRIRRDEEINRKARLERAFTSQAAAPAKDPVPQAVAEVFVNKDVLGADGLPVDENVDCRARMCMISARFAPGKDGSDWTNRVLIELAGSLPQASVITVPDGDGGTEVRIYAARTGEADVLAHP